MPPIRPPTAADTTKLFLLGAIWGSAFLCIAIALEDFQPMTVAAIRITLAGLALCSAAWLRGERGSVDGRILLLLVLIGFFNSALPFTLISWGQQHIDSSRAAILMAMGPFIVLLMSHLFTNDDRLTAPKLAGMALGFGGVVLLIGADVLFGARSGVLGQLAVVGASTSYAIAGLLTRRAATLPPLLWSGIVLMTASAYMVPAALLVDQPWTATPEWRSVAALLFLSVGPTGFAYVLRFQIIRNCGMTFMSQVSYLVPMFGVFWGWLFLAETPSPRLWAALALIVAGIYVSRLGRRRGAGVAVR